MRLVDADALLKRKGCVYDSEGHVLFAVGTDDIVHAPTIDAIPVEWLEEQRDKLSEAWDEEWHGINGLIEQWQEEQEAQK